MGDTNGDGSATTPARGDWMSIWIADHIVKNDAPASVFDYTTLRYGGYGSNNCAGYSTIQVVDPESRLVVSNSLIEESQSGGVGLPSGLTGHGFAGIYNTRFDDSGCGVWAYNSSKAEVVGNTFSGTFDTFAFDSVNPGRIRFWFNTVNGRIRVMNGASPAVTRAQADVRYNSLLGRISSDGYQLADWSSNWFGHDANAVLPTCLDPAIADAHVPAINTVSSSACPAGQVKVLGYSSAVTPALSASPQVLPAALREAAAPRFGPVDTYSGALTYAAQDLVVEDAGKQVTATRTYRSDRLSSGDAGEGWSSAFTESLSQSAGIATLNMSDGSALAFATDAASGYSPAPGVALDYVVDAAGSSVTTPEQTTYRFNPAGELTGMLLGDDGHELTVQRSGGHVNRVTGVSGRYLNFSRSGGKLTTVADQAGRDVSLAYSGDRLASVQGVDSQTESYTYDSAGRLTRVTTPAGRVKLAAHYGSDGRVDWVEQQGTGRATIDYDDTNARRTITLADGATIVQEYDFAGRLVAEQVGAAGTHVVYDGDGRVVSTITGVPAVPMEGYGPSAPATLYDGKGDPVLTVDATGRYTATTFNSKHRPLVSTLADGSTVVRTYNSAGRIATLTDPRGKQWEYGHNSRGQITSQTDPLGRARTIAYQGDGDVESVTDETGATTLFTHDTHGRRTVATDPAGNATQFAFTSWNEVRQTTRPRGGATTVTFDDDRQPITVTDPASGVTTYTYDPAGRLSTIEDAENGVTSLEYDVVGRAKKVTDARGSIYGRTYTTEGWTSTSTDPAGAVTTTVNDPQGRPVRITNPLGHVTQTQYDRAGRTTTVWTPDGAKWSYGYDNLGRRNLTTTPRGKQWKAQYDSTGNLVKTTDPLNHTTLAGYDNAGRVTSTTDQAGVVTTIAYNDIQRSITRTDPLGVLEVIRRDAAGRVTSHTDGAGMLTSWAYDADGNATSTTDPAGTATAEYDLAGRVTAEQDATARRTTGSYDLLGRLTSRTHPGNYVEQFGYDSVGNLTSYTDPTDAETTYAYDPANRVTTSTDPLGEQTTYTYDLLGRQTSITDPTGVVANTAYDPVGRPAVRWDATGASWVSTYDLDGNLIGDLDPTGVRRTYRINDRGETTGWQWGTTCGCSFGYTYDAVGRLSQETRLLTPFISYEYNIRGDITAVKNGVNDRTAITRDGAGRATSSTTPLGHTSTWTYDTAGRLETATDPLSNTSTYTWDPAGRPTGITLPRGGDYTYTYDPAGRLDTEQDPLEHTTSYDYDPAGRLTTTTYPTGRTVTADYDDAGRRTTLTAGGITRTYGYDDAGRLASASVSGQTPAVAALTYSYDNRGLMATSTDALGTSTYGYDVAGRLASRAPPVGPTTSYTYNDKGLLATTAGPTNRRFGYDSYGQLTILNSNAPSTGLTQYGYDNAGRLETITGSPYAAAVTYTDDSQIASIETDKLTSYTYDNAGRLTNTTVTQTSTTLSNTSYGWDGDGNRTTVTPAGGPAITSTYDLADRLTGTSTGQTYTHNDDGLQTVAGTTSHTYNGFGEPVTATTPAGTVGYNRDPLGRTAGRTTTAGTETLGYDGPTGALTTWQPPSGAATSLIRTPDGDLLAEKTGTATTLQASLNVHGDLTALKDDTGSTVRWRGEYNPFGETTSTTGTPAAPVGFQAMYTDPATGLVDMGTRQYNPTTGAFTTPDSIIGALTKPITLNRYLYAHGDPINLFDPDGRWPGWLDDAIDAVVDFISDAIDAIGNLIDDAVEAVNDAADAISGAWNDATEGWKTTKTKAKRKWSSTLANARNLAAEISSNTSKFWEEHGDRVKSTLAGIAIGTVIIGGCVALGILTAGIAGAICVGAALGAVYGGAFCDIEKHGTAGCLAIGTTVGAVSGAVAGVAATAGAGAFTVGATSAFAGDATDQLLTTGTINPQRLATATITGGALGWAGGKLLTPSATRAATAGHVDELALPAGPSPSTGPVTLLGKYDDIRGYIKRNPDKSFSADFLDIKGTMAGGEKGVGGWNWTRNKRFIDKALESGGEIRLVTTPYSTARKSPFFLAGKTYKRELKYLEGKGYGWEQFDDYWRVIRIRPPIIR
ncbi:hypothetical protein Pa4123_86610 [Phytohabitans aurantiacus]|uniref:Type IV secretion protein Rhs n=2 Tax=Phytohabitans aurantiacus TaxID=3016789 RepID=A0ABQ5R9X4_9ACTN|nr:hypothetical protein Pa4123_86610 [Phytohabitans aurantiacus]